MPLGLFHMHVCD